MLTRLRLLLRTRRPRPSPSIPTGERVYAVGDVHGRRDLFDALRAAIDADDRQRGPASTTVILLGDLVDRGPDSAGVIAAARAWQQQRTVRCLAGNHEEMFLKSFEDQEALRQLLQFGGRETILSYRVDSEQFLSATLKEVQELMKQAVPIEDIEFLHRCEDCISFGDYLFVHAGIRPNRRLDHQHRRDLRWIREPFLSHRGNFGHVVVHGHTVFDQPNFKPNRIGLDTGAYKSGRLTALGLEGTGRWLIEAQKNGGRVLCTTRAA